MMRRTIYAAMFLAMALPAWGQGFQLLDIITPDFSGDVTQDHIPQGPYFGHSIAADGGWLVVGTPHYRWSPGHKPGMVARFQRVGDQWQSRGRETLTSGEFDEARCGHTVALVAAPSARDTAFGCPFANNVNTLTANTGAAQLKNEGDDASLFFGASEFAGFGRSVGMTRASDGKVFAAVGAPAEQQVFIFRRNPGGMDWSFVASVSPSSGATGFGQSVAIAAGSDGQWLWLAVGAPNWSVDQGKAFVYRSGDPANQTWQEIAELTASNGQNFDEFGASLDYRANGSNHQDDLLVVGAPGRYTGGNTSLDHRRGTVSVFRHGATAGNFTHEGDVMYQCLFDPNGICTDLNQPMRFGHAVAIDDQEAIWIGALNFDYDGELDVGRVYRARYVEPGSGALFTGWRINRALFPEPPEDDCGPGSTRFSTGQFGASLAPIAGGVAVGFPAHGCSGAGHTGQVRVYGFPDDLFADRFEIP